MKRVLCLLWFVMVLSFTACSRQEQTPGAAFQPPVEEIQWGMMPEEVAEILELPEECIQNNDDGTALLLCEGMDVLGQNADVYMAFDLRYQFGLVNVIVCFTDFPDESLVETLNGMYGDFTAVDSKGVPSRWESEKVEELSERLQERFRHIWVDAPSWNEEQSVLSKENVWETKKSQALVTVTLNGDVLYYNAGNMAVYLIYEDDDAYEQLQDTLNTLSGN